MGYSGSQIPHSLINEYAPLVHFTETEVASNAAKVEKCFSDIMSKFLPKYKGLFSSEVVQNWTLWKERALERCRSRFKYVTKRFSIIHNIFILSLF